MIAIIALILIIMRAFNLTIGIVPITMYSHQFIFYGTYNEFMRGYF